MNTDRGFKSAALIAPTTHRVPERAVISIGCLAAAAAAAAHAAAAVLCAFQRISAEKSVKCAKLTCGDFDQFTTRRRMAKIAAVAAANRSIAIGWPSLQQTKSQNTYAWCVRARARARARANACDSSRAHDARAHAFKSVSMTAEQANSEAFLSSRFHWHLVFEQAAKFRRLLTIAACRSRAVCIHTHQIRRSYNKFFLR